MVNDNKVHVNNTDKLTDTYEVDELDHGTEIKTQEQKKEKKEKVGFFRLFRFATIKDKIFMFIGTLGCIGNGCMLPLVMLFFTNIIDEFASFGKDCDAVVTNTTSTDNDAFGSLLDNMRDQAVYLCYVAVASIVFTYFQVAFWLWPAEDESLILRKNLFSSILRQEMGWFDVYKSGELTNRLTDDVNKIKDALGDKCGNAIQYISTFVAGVILGLIRGWKLTLVVLSVSPVLIVASYYYTKIAEEMTSEELTSYAKAGSIADEVLTAIRTVFAFNGGHKELKRYEKQLDNAKYVGIRKAFFNGLLMGVLWLAVFGAYGLGFWYGWTLSIDPDEDYTVGTILLVFFVIIIGVFSLGNAAPFIGTLSTARAAAYEIFKVIDRNPDIDSSSEKGTKNPLNGNIEFKGVNFCYPSRKEVQVLKGTSLKIKSGSTVAFVGSSGCGKSTCIQLIQRFYDPSSGEIIIDGENIKDINIKWLRTQLGVVNQEPILFGTSIKENIRFGKDGVSDEDIVNAAKNANAHNFIEELPDKYETLVGDRGGQLSGGQKQRIAIARALVRNPKILLLDEATSALDNESEGIVQAALDKASAGRTTIVVAHRLTTIRNADVIYAFDKGVVAESGSHDELMKKQGIYNSLVTTQEANREKDEVDAKKYEGLDLKEINKSQKRLEQLKSVDVTEEEKKEEGEKEENKKEPSMFKVYGLNKPEFGFIFIGCIAAIVSGGVQPAFGVILSKSISLFQLCSESAQKYRIDLYCSMFALIGVISLISNTLQSGMFGISGENLTKRLRSKGFKTILSQEIGWFDAKENSIGVLSTKLSTEAAAVQGATGVRLGFVLMNIANLGVGLVIAFVYSWPITLLIIAFIPLLIIGGIFQMQALAGFAGKNKETLEQVGSISNESISNIRTVVILNKETYFIDKYGSLLDIPHKRTIKSHHLNGFILGFTNSVMFFAMAAAFILGAYLVENDLFDQNLEDIMIVFNCVLFGAQAVGQAAGILPDYGKAMLAVASMFDLFEREPKINNWGEEGEKLTDKEFDGNIELKKVEFTYPSRQNAQILKKLDLSIKKGQRIALVGSSGCGKSTVTQLLERFYDPDEGEVTLSGKPLNKLDLYWLRNQIGIVSQEPILFDLSIAENIQYGDNSRDDISKEEIIEAAKKANIHDFISKLPKAYDTNCGAKGTQLSGGQKQRIAIARALIRDPKILLLDEATSALDTESEKMVQDALDKAQQGRTCIIIAHRLSTIRNCDVIIVLQKGVVKESGTHDELMRLNGFYAKLNAQQK